MRHTGPDYAPRGRSSSCLAGIAASGQRSAELAARYGDLLIAVGPDADVVIAFDAAGGSGKPKYGQVPVCYGPDTSEAREHAARLWGWASPGWKVMAELPGPASFAACSSLIRPEEITASVPCGPELKPYLEPVRAYQDAGFTHVALVQIGAERQDQFFRFAAADLLPRFAGAVRAREPTLSGLPPAGACPTVAAETRARRHDDRTDG